MEFSHKFPNLSTGSKIEMVTHRQLRWFRQPNFDIFRKDTLIKNRTPCAGYVAICFHSWRCAHSQEHYSIYCHTKEIQNYLHVSPSYYNDSSHICRKHRQKILTIHATMLSSTHRNHSSHTIFLHSDKIISTRILHNALIGDPNT